MDILVIVLAVLLLISLVVIFLLKNNLKKEKTKSDNLISDVKRLDSYGKGIDREKNELIKKYKPILDIDEAIREREKLVQEQKISTQILIERYQKGFEKYESLKKEIAVYEGEFEMLEHGAYMPFFDFETSEVFKEAIKNNKLVQRQMIKDKEAAVCSTEWTVGNSKREGTKMTNKAIKLTLRAFNGECDALISKVKWNNIQAIENRILKSYEAINKANEANKITIEYAYFNLKLNEARLTHEYNLKKHEEKEEQRAIREEMREEERANREIEKAKREAEKEEERYEKALKQAQEDIANAKGEKLNKLESKIAKLQEALNNAHTMKERAISRAQVTKSGHVYVISNIGSFGEQVFKIGMTRRLEPMDRVKELGDASVPFQFDVHAMIYSENAPGLEAELHRKFNDRRINKVNYRKEYFSINIDEIQKAVNEIAGAEIEVMKIAEAHEYKETLAIELKNNETKDVKLKLEKLPEFSKNDLFD